MNTILFDINGNRALVDINNIQEILERPKEITKIINSNDWIRGLIDLRGEGITIIDLKKIINADEDAENTSTSNKPVVIIIKNKNGEKLGVEVDNIHHVQEISEDNQIIQNTSNGYSRFFPTVVKVKENLTFIFDVETIFEDYKNKDKK